jgi:hypothetical protein
MPKKGGGILGDIAAVAKTRAQLEAFKQLEEPANQAIAAKLIADAPGVEVPEKMRILDALTSVVAQAKQMMTAPAAGAPVQSIPAAAGSSVQNGGKTRRRRHRRRTHKKFSK